MLSTAKSVPSKASEKSWKPFTCSGSPLKLTVTSGREHAAASQARACMNLTWSSSSFCNPKRRKSGLYRTPTEPRVTSDGRSEMTGSRRFPMLSSQRCRNLFPVPGSSLCTSKTVLKAFVALAPTPLRPPVKRTMESSKLSPLKNSPNTRLGTYGPDACLSTGMAPPLFQTLISFSSWFTPMRISVICFPSLSANCLSNALTKISLKHCTKPGDNLRSSSIMVVDPPSVRRIHADSSRGSTGPMYMSGRFKT
mmetsp:Transcript_30499/g.55284  ORF Transcript_30499/g.55284 Transcript_30499/m.55284 type:complete len:252 (-) Transcript_30499:315-1070(-)